MSHYVHTPWFDHFNNIMKNLKYEVPLYVQSATSCHFLSPLRLHYSVQQYVHTVQTCSGVHPTSYTIGTGGKAAEA
jgi:hypothetical protein